MSGLRIRPDTMRVKRLTAVKKEAEETVSLHFSDELCSHASPGQYVMVWNPEAEEVPMSLSSMEHDGTSSVLVRQVGESTRALCGLKRGDRIGLRGPFGNGYTIHGSSPLIVAGGTGAAPLTPLAEKMASERLRPTFVLGARSEDQLVYRGRLEKLLGRDLLIATDDGSSGFKGLASEYAAKLMGRRRFDSVYVCGPELMMAAIFKEAVGMRVPIQASLERYIKCAVGLCGICAIGPFRVCKDGPVFNTEQLLAVQDEFGKKRMEPSGRAVRVDK